MSIVLFLIILIALILVHEFGHFIVAKRSGVRVDEFGIGFPPKVWGKKFGETEYTINALPFGGFVRIFGEDPNEESLKSPHSMVAKPWYIKAAIIVAGVVMNILFAWFLFVIVFALGPQEADVNTPDAEMLVTHIVADSPAEKAGLKTGDVILSVSDGTTEIPARDPAQVSEFIGKHPGSPVTVALKRDGVPQSITANPVTGMVAAEPERGALGFGLGLFSTTPLPLPEALYRASALTGTTLWAIATSLVGFFASAFMLTADLSQVTGPVGIVGLVGDAATLGFLTVLSFTAFISLNLAVINLLPFPALDGGRFVVTLAEAIRGKMFPTTVVNAINGVGFILLIILMIVVTWSDIMKLIG